MNIFFRYIYCILLALSPTLLFAQEEEEDTAAIDSTFSDEEIVEVSDVNGSHFCLLAEFGLTTHKDPSVGLTISYMQQWGGYITAHINGIHKNMEDIYVDENGIAENGQEAFLSGESKVARLSAVGGVTYVLLPKLIVYLGGGYGYRRLLFETADGKYLKEKKNTIEGYEIDLGAIGNFNNLLVKLGVNTTKFKSADVRIGVGYRF